MYKTLVYIYIYYLFVFQLYIHIYIIPTKNAYIAVKKCVKLRIVERFFKKNFSS